MPIVSIMNWVSARSGAPYIRNSTVSACPTPPSSSTDTNRRRDATTAIDRATATSATTTCIAESARTAPSVEPASCARATPITSTTTAKITAM